MAAIFISHRGRDQAEAPRLASELSVAGHDVRLDVWDLHVGDSVVEWMNSGLKGSRYLVLCYSSAGTLAPWIDREWMSSLARQLNGEDVRVLPARLTGDDAPAILADIKYADLVRRLGFWNCRPAPGYTMTQVPVLVVSAEGEDNLAQLLACSTRGRRIQRHP